MLERRLIRCEVVMQQHAASGSLALHFNYCNLLVRQIYIWEKRSVHLIVADCFLSY